MNQYAELPAAFCLAQATFVAILASTRRKASARVQDYKRAWPLWREKALAQAKAERK